jgi:hypothetical protein
MNTSRYRKSFRTVHHENFYFISLNITDAIFWVKTNTDALKCFYTRLIKICIWMEAIQLKQCCSITY